MLSSSSCFTWSQQKAQYVGAADVVQPPWYLPAWTPSKRPLCSTAGSTASQGGSQGVAAMQLSLLGAVCEKTSMVAACRPGGRDCDYTFPRSAAPFASFQPGPSCSSLDTMSWGSRPPSLFLSTSHTAARSESSEFVSDLRHRDVSSDNCGNS